MKNTIKKSLRVKLGVVSRYLYLKEFISLLAILMSLLTYGQREMTAKEGFYYLYKVSNEKITDDAIKNYNNRSFNMNWFFLYANTFDKTNCDNARENEFKWPKYSAKIQNEINQGKNNADFNKLFSYTSIAEFGKYNSQYGGFPISNGWKRIFSNRQFINYPINIYVGKYWINKAYFDNLLMMNPEKAEKLVERHPGKRKIEIKVIYNVVDKDMKNVNKWDKKYLEIYVRKVIYLDGSNILGEIIPDKNHQDIEKTRILKAKPNIEVIKRDLLGKKLYVGENVLASAVWSFDGLQEFKKAAILNYNLKQGQFKTFYLNFNVDLELKDYTAGTSFKTNVDVNYTLINYKWVFDSVEGNSYEKLKAANIINTNSQVSSFQKGKSIDKVKFIGYYNKDLPSGDYILYDKNVYYKAQGIEISSIAVEDVFGKPITNSRIKLGSPLFLKIKIKRPNQSSRKFRYFLSFHVEDTEGQVYSSEKVSGKIPSESSWISIPGGIRRMVTYSNSKETYLSFEIKDRDSNAIIQGYMKFTVFR